MVLQKWERCFADLDEQLFENRKELYDYYSGKTGIVGNSGGKGYFISHQTEKLLYQKSGRTNGVMGVLATRDTAIIHFTKELHGVSNQARTSLIRCILQHINLKIYDTIKVTELAKQFYLSESALRRRFKEEVGISINEYVNQRKIEESKMMLQSGVPVGEIARRLSFYDLSHYYRTFKKYTGMTPQYFRDTNVVA